MTYEKAIVKIQEQFVELWNDEFEFNENEWDVDRYMLDEWMFDSCIFDHLPINNQIQIHNNADQIEELKNG